MVVHKMISGNSFNLGKVFEEIDDDTSPHQSANSLFHFLKDISYLQNLIKDKCFKPWYVEENIEYLNFQRLKQIYIPMKCFCDINLHKLEHHILYYGDYGIGFSKQWGINNGIQPITYINNHSYLSDSLHSSILNNYSNADSADLYPLQHLLFTKSIYGKQMDKYGRTHIKNYMDESEWRYVFDMEKECSDCKQIYPSDEESTILNLNLSLQQKDSSSLTFKYSDIKYIILKDKEDFLKIIETINNISINKTEKNLLISKIIIWNDSKEDF